MPITPASVFNLMNQEQAQLKVLDKLVQTIDKCLQDVNWLRDNVQLRSVSGDYFVFNFELVDNIINDNTLDALRRHYEYNGWHLMVESTNERRTAHVILYSKLELIPEIKLPLETPPETPNEQPQA